MFHLFLHRPLFEEYLNFAKCVKRDRENEECRNWNPAVNSRPQHCLGTAASAKAIGDTPNKVPKVGTCGAIESQEGVT